LLVAFPAGVLAGDVERTTDDLAGWRFFCLVATSSVGVVRPDREPGNPPEGLQAMPAAVFMESFIEISSPSLRRVRADWAFNTPEQFAAHIKQRIVAYGRAAKAVRFKPE